MAKAKQTKTAPEAADTSKAPAGESIAAKAERNANDRFTRVFGKDGKAVVPTGKVPPQVACILNVLEAAGPEGLMREELSKNLKGVLVTRQPESRIVTYYQKLMVESGAVTRTTGAPAA